MKMVMRMDALFLVDREARQQGMTAAERLALRREHAREWVDEIRQACRRSVETDAAAECVGQGGRPTR